MTFIGCNDSEVMEQGTSTIEERIPVTLNVAIPLADLPSSRAITDDSAIHNYEIWVFSKGQLYERIKPGDKYQGKSKVELSGDGELKLLLPEGLQDVTLAMVANVNNISAGQKQLLTIARAYLSNRPILILDEATRFPKRKNIISSK